MHNSIGSTIFVESIRDWITSIMHWCVAQTANSRLPQLKLDGEGKVSFIMILKLVTSQLYSRVRFTAVAKSGEVRKSDVKQCVQKQSLFILNGPSANINKHRLDLNNKKFANSACCARSSRNLQYGFVLALFCAFNFLLPHFRAFYIRSFHFTQNQVYTWPP